MAETIIVPENDVEIPSVLLPCAVCQRTFRPEALAKHIKVCEKSLSKKRKVFDSSKQRIQGTELEEFLPVLPVLPSIRKPEKSPVRKIQSKWKEKTSEVLHKIRASNSKPAEEAPVDSGQCPFCTRYFGKKAYDRHVAWCKEHQAIAHPLSPASLQARERLEARTKYQAPLLKKCKLTVKEKYSPHPKRRDPSPAGVKTSTATTNTAPVIQTRNLQDNENSNKPATNSNFQRGFSFRGSKRVPSPSKKNVTSSSKNDPQSGDSSNVTTPSIPSSGRSKQTDESVEDMFSRSCTITPIQPSENTHKPKIVTSSCKNSTSDDNYDPFMTAEHQLMELLGMKEGERNKSNISPLDKSSCLLSSPTSAFAKFTPISPSSSSPSPKNENETIPPPSSFEDLEAQCASPLNMTLQESNLVKDKNRNQISLSSLSLCSTISIESIDLNRNGLRKGLSSSAKTQENKKEKAFQRSISLVDAPRRVRDSSKNRLKMEDLLYGSSQVDNERYFGSPIPKDHLENSFKINYSDNSSDASLHRPDEETLNAEQELLQSLSAYENLFKSESPFISSSLESLKLFPSLGGNSNREHSSKNEMEKTRNKNEVNKSGLDSAYNSLNRKSPLNESINTDPGTRSSSESDSPAVAARFCHECGNKYPTSTAKFCCNCGVRRVFL